MRRFVGIDQGREGAPGESAVLQFRHLLEQRGLAKQVFAEVSTYLSEHGTKLPRGSIVGATIIAAPFSSRSQAKAPDPEIQQARKGNWWYFRMKAHIGVDFDSGWCTR